MPDLKGQLAIVTGASSGLGEATAVRLAERGARVALLARSEADLDRVAARIGAGGGAAFAVPTDLADPVAVVAAAERLVSGSGPPRVLINAAATDAPGPAEEVPVADWQRVIAVNLTAPFLLSRAVFPHMRAAGGGTIVNVSSVAGRRGWANASAYCATKFGLTGLTRALAAEGAPHGVRVVSLYPGAMATHWGTWNPADRGQPSPAGAEDALPPEDVAAYIAWLVCAPAHLIVTEAVVTPIRERGWP
ncbi:MAG TPA: SDR family oxidoreductase [Streptosporangiaceae bacterium]|jgi:NAD(P)-dependent dehydrogenase (short-subunit alcohol dehydrogenase family)|nr:SDR family oxidoreductase [Streptosporangiaceae bacterium]